MQVKSQISTRLDQLGYVPQTAAIAYDAFIRSLKKDETILYLLEGSIANTLGFVISTDLRLYYVGIDKHKNPFIHHIGYDEVLDITFRETFMPSVELNALTKHHGLLKIKGCDPETGREFVELINLLTKRPSND